MKGRRSSSSSSSFRQFGQLSIFHCNLREREKKTGGAKPSASPVSLLDFLNKKMEKRSGKTLQGNLRTDSSCPSSSTPVGIPRVLSGGTSIKSQQLHSNTFSTSAAFLQLKRDGSHNSLLANPKGHWGKSQVESLQPANFPCSSYAEAAPAGEESRSDLRKRKSSSFGDDVQRCSSSCHLLVLGDDPKPRKKPNMQGWTQEKPTFFNHYADGGGWWDTGMVGVDSEEVGSTEIWEGMGTTTIGGS